MTTCLLKSQVCTCAYKIHSSRELCYDLTSSEGKVCVIESNGGSNLTVVKNPTKYLGETLNGTSIFTKTFRSAYL